MKVRRPDLLEQTVVEHRREELFLALDLGRERLRQSVAALRLRADGDVLGLDRELLLELIDLGAELRIAQAGAQKRGELHEALVLEPSCHGLAGGLGARLELLDARLVVLDLDLESALLLHLLREDGIHLRELLVELLRAREVAFLLLLEASVVALLVIVEGRIARDDQFLDLGQFG